MTSPRPWALFVVATAVIVAFAVLAATGISVWPLVLAVAGVGAVALGRLIGLVRALPLVVLLFLLLLLGVTIVTGAAHATGTPMVVCLCGAYALAGVAACLGLIRWPATTTWTARGRALLGWLPAAAGAVVWGLTMLSAALVPGAGVLSWVMQGDSANNVLYAREMITRGGLQVGAGANPVPLASALMGSIMAPGRGGVPSSQLASHDIQAFVGLWAVTIAGSCLLSGALVAVVVRRAGAGPLLAGLASAGASLLPLTWFISGYSIEFGFFNTQVAFPIVMAGIILALTTHRRPVLGLTAQFVVATLTLAVWSPLVLIPAALGLMIVIRDARRLLHTTAWERILLVLGLLQLLTYVGILVIPSLLTPGNALSAVGGAFPFRKFMLPALAVGTITLALVAFLRRSGRTRADIIAVSIASGAGLAALAVVSGHPLGQWTYYPEKFSWIASTILLVLLVGVAAAAVARWVRPRSLELSVSVLTAALICAFLGWAPASGQGYLAKSPTERILEGGYSGHGDDVARLVFRLSDLERPAILIRSGEPDEATVDFWLLQLQANSLSRNFDLRRLAYYLDPKSVADVCSAAHLIGRPLVVYTADGALASRVAKTCGSESIDVRGWSTRSP